MSRPASNPFFEADFSKLMDVSRMMSDFKMPMMPMMPMMQQMMPMFDSDAMMGAARRNMEAAAAVNQSAFEAMQALIRRQADMMREGFEHASSMMNAVMSSPSPQEKVIRHAEASKVAVDKALANARDIAETVSRCHSQAMDTVSTRMSEGLEELRGMMLNSKAA